MSTSTRRGTIVQQRTIADQAGPPASDKAEGLDTAREMRDEPPIPSLTILGTGSPPSGSSPFLSSALGS